ncbi:MauE/DoxX family redox-associated membrane protein [Fodinicola feengrottensis]|uniref:MauE/DoxX family redox-associated membrane protein n=1 Tax=Fodinicola feengrottensis TaxID=435914 RepID=UPI002441899A|nr:MauE/DoxX family redox-associated membrane protein [Fodinicola feengrottensis]
MTQVSVQRPAGRTAWWPATQPWLSTVLRLALAVIWILAAWPKVTDLDNNIRSVRAYELGIPDTLVQVIGIGQPFLELVLGLLLIVGLGVRLMSAASALLFVISSSASSRSGSGACGSTAAASPPAGSWPPASTRSTRSRSPGTSVSSRSLSCW